VSDALEILRDALLVAFGLAVLVAEVWLATTGESLLLCGTLLAMTGFTLYIVLSELWEDYRPTY
jgi:hypothetical protein